jgi:hypothetical protein
MADQIKIKLPEVSGWTYAWEFYRMMRMRETALRSEGYEVYTSGEEQYIVFVSEEAAALFKLTYL